MSEEGLLLLIAGSGFLLTGLGIPLTLRKIRPNMFYGCRTAKTLSDPAVWYAANEVCGRNFLIAGVAIVAATLLISPFLTRLGADFAAAALLIVLVTSIILAVVGCGRTIRKL